VAAHLAPAARAHDQSLGVPHVSPKQVEAVEIPLPPLLQQKHLADTLTERLEKAERTRQAIQDQLDAIDKLPATLLRRAFNGEL